LVVAPLPEPKTLFAISYPIPVLDRYTIILLVLLASEIRKKSPRADAHIITPRVPEAFVGYTQHSYVHAPCVNPSAGISAMRSHPDAPFSTEEVPKRNWAVEIVAVL
jgi:hypothetical protein